MIRTFRILSALLDYPDRELFEALPEVPGFLEQDGVLSADQVALVEKFVREMGKRQTLATLQADYSALFDSGRRESLYLFDYVYGEKRERGEAMVDLLATYEASGAKLREGELPDYLPVLLEFAAEQPDTATALKLLAELGGVLRVMERQFEDQKHPYAPVITVLRELSGAERKLSPSTVVPIKPAGDRQ
ncbi:MAG: nitrate reductase molybdenum cofactor assembly chaperone [Sutterellaceae bacterium]|nr:nitrate reductase molybdenum cofactor assembly chaperone [Sutterellaceae bacterium]MDD7441788.1 nitrate reductase molybdenum cofactor assembly chaperone [Sutterellaceae bacterium]MDY2867503.1 nitrate reductase molybdenum cofactor assembly chaperone [Mesosutterella sp.]